MSRVTPIQAVVNYQNSQNARNSDSDASIDRARGGIIKIRLVWPEYSGNTTGRDREPFKIPERVCEFEIDLEQLPLVNVASYKVEEEQIGPEEIPYPNGVVNPWPGTFS
jgi:hypothetical protein